MNGQNSSKIDIEIIVRQYFATRGLSMPRETSDDLRDAGLSSIDLVDLIFLVEEAVAMKIPDSEIVPSNFRSVDNIASLIDRLRHAA